MKCFYHPDKDAVGTCSQCGKAACRECLYDVGGAMLCKDCMARQLRTIQTEQHAEALNSTQIIEAAKRRLRWSKLLFVGITIFGFLIGIVSCIGSLGSNDPNAPSFLAMLFGVPLGSVIAGYLFWSCYWGIPAAYRWVKNGLSNIGCFIFANPITWLILIITTFYILFFFGYMYGVFGGGFYEYFKCKRVAEGVA